MFMDSVCRAPSFLLDENINVKFQDWLGILVIDLDIYYNYLAFAQLRGKLPELITVVPACMLDLTWVKVMLSSLIHPSILLQLSKKNTEWKLKQSGLYRPNHMKVIETAVQHKPHIELCLRNSIFSEKEHTKFCYV